MTRARTSVSSVLRLGLLGAVAGIAALVANPAAAELKKWDQPAVTATAKKLSTASEAFWQAMRRNYGDTVGSGVAQDNTGLQSRSRTFTEMTGSLAGHLSKGDGRDKTLDMYKSMKEMFDTMQDSFNRDETDKPTNDAWNDLMAQVKAIAPYYDPNAPADVKVDSSIEQPGQ